MTKGHTNTWAITHTFTHTHVRMHLQWNLHSHPIESTSTPYNIYTLLRIHVHMLTQFWLRAYRFLQCMYTRLQCIHTYKHSAWCPLSGFIKNSKLKGADADMESTGSLPRTVGLATASLMSKSITEGVLCDVFTWSWSCVYTRMDSDTKLVGERKVDR